MSELLPLFTLLLWVAALLALIGGMLMITVVIVIVIAVNSGVAFIQEYRADQIGQRLRGLLPMVAAVVRDGRQLSVDAAELVVDDVVLLAPGDRVPADVRLTRTYSLTVDESPLTGKSTPARLATGATAHAGTYITAGAAEGVVVATGARTRLAAVTSRPRAARRPVSPLTGNLRDLTAFTAVGAAGVGVLFFGFSLLLETPVSSGFLLGVGVSLALMPQGLLPTVTLSLAWAAQRMSRDNALVRSLGSVESLGAATFVCTGATGFLTSDEASVVQVWTPTGTVRVEGDGYTPRGSVFGDDRAVATVRELAETAVLSSGGGIRFDDGGWRPVGDPTEAALHVLAARVAADGVTSPVLRRYPFDPRRRRSSVVAGGAVHVKGAPDAVLPRCWNGSEAHAALREMTERGLRVLAVARRTAAVPLDAADATDSAAETADVAEQDLTLLGLAGLHVPPCPGVRAAVDRCRRAGVRVAMVTGDHPETARALAREVGLIADDPLVLTGAELPPGLQDLGELLDRDEVVLARVTPEDRLRVTVALQHRGHVVALTGSGVDDRPALRRADVGVSPGGSGSDAAREAADLVLLDDRFQTLVTSIGLGRAAFADIRRILTYRLTGDTAEFAPFLLWAVTGGSVPLALGALQILALDIGVSLLPMLSLGAEPLDPRVMRTGPPSWENLIDRRLLVRVLGILGPVEAVVTVFAFLIVLWTGGWSWGTVPAPTLLAAASGAAFATLALGQLSTVLACRSETDPFDFAPWRRNPQLLFAIGVGAAALWVFLALPPLPTRLGASPPPGVAWPAILCVVPAVLAADTIHKVVRASNSPTH